MRIAAITKPLHVASTPGDYRPDEGAHHQKLNYCKMSMRALKTYLCRAGNDDCGVILCSRYCCSFSVCQFGQEYIRREEE